MNMEREWTSGSSGGQRFQVHGAGICSAPGEGLLLPGNMAEGVTRQDRIKVLVQVSIPLMKPPVPSEGPHNHNLLY